MKRVLGPAMVLACVGLLSSCSLLPVTPVANPFGSSVNPDSVMQHIADAVKSHDAAALNKLFSPRARERATDLDGGLAYFLSVLPSARLTWKIEDGGPSSTSVKEDGYTEEMFAFYKVSVNGKEYEVYFADITINTNDPKNVGIYALGVQRYSSHPYTASGEPKQFFVWANSHNLAGHNVVTGTPGVYVPQK